MKRRFDPSGPLRGTLRAPGDKSLSHRAALFGAMCADPCRSRATSTPPTRARR